MRHLIVVYGEDIQVKNKVETRLVDPGTREGIAKYMDNWLRREASRNHNFEYRREKIESTHDETSLYFTATEKIPTRLFQSLKEVESDDYVSRPIFLYGNKQDGEAGLYRNKIHCDYGKARLVDFEEIDKTKFKTAIARTEARYDRIVLYSDMPISKQYFENSVFSTMGAIELKQPNGDVGMVMMDKRSIVDIFKEGGEIELDFSRFTEELTIREYVEKYPHI